MPTASDRRTSTRSQRASLPSIRSATIRRLEKSSDQLVAATLARMATDLDWFEVLSAQTRSYIGLVVQAGILGFITWLQAPGDAPQPATDVFGAAPRSTASEVSLQQVVDMVRLMVDVIESETPRLATDDEANALREAVLFYSREVAFGAAVVYATAAEQRGAWDARLEALVIDALVAGSPDDDLLARAAAFGWDSTRACWVIVGSAHDGTPQSEIARLRRSARGLGLQALAGAHGRHLIALVQCTSPKELDRAKQSQALAEHFGEDQVVIGPRATDLLDARRSASAALAGIDAAPAWPDAPRPVDADDLLPGRALNGDPLARETLISTVYRPLQASPDLLRTVQVLAEQGGGLEASARQLYVHTNTVRYRIARVGDLIGYDPAKPREALALATAIRLGLLQPQP